MKYACVKYNLPSGIGVESSIDDTVDLIAAAHYGKLYSCGSGNGIRYLNYRFPEREHAVLFIKKLFRKYDDSILLYAELMDSEFTGGMY